jgi:hypothetical protein
MIPPPMRLNHNRVPWESFRVSLHACRCKVPQPDACPSGRPCWGAGCYAGLQDCACTRMATLRQLLVRGATLLQPKPSANSPKALPEHGLLRCDQAGCGEESPVSYWHLEVRSPSWPEHQKKRSLSCQVSVRRRGSSSRDACVRRTMNYRCCSRVTITERRPFSIPGPRRMSGRSPATATLRSPGFSRGSWPRGATPAFLDRLSCERQVEASEASSRMRWTSTAKVRSSVNSTKQLPQRARISLLFPALTLFQLPFSVCSHCWVSNCT